MLMLAKVVHRASAVFISIFVVIHLLNHVWGVLGAEDHINMMNNLRVYYRNSVAEMLLLTSVVIQMISGIKLCVLGKTQTKTSFEKLQQWTGLYLLFFLVIHVSAVLGARLLFHLDTNYYFGAAGINTFPLNLFFIPYYGLAIISFFGHIATIHGKKIKQKIFSLTPAEQSTIILILGVCLTVLIFYGLTNHFHGVEIPKEYNVLIGK